MKLRGMYLGFLLVFICMSSHADLKTSVIDVNQYLNPVQIFTRCYIRMVRNFPAENDALLIAVKNGSKSAPAACIEVFERAQFTNDGVLKTRSSPEAQAILKTFHDLHGSWFLSKLIYSRPGTLLIHDTEESPLYFTRAAFQPKVEFKSVITLNHGLAGVRDQISYPNEDSNFLAQTLLSYAKEMPYKSETDFILAYRNMTLVGSTYKTVGYLPVRVSEKDIAEVGVLTGVKKAPSIILPSFAIKTTGLPDLKQSIQKNVNNLEINGHLGGGVIGSQSFIRNNANLVGGELTDGYGLINRRLTARIYEDLLCHQLPTLKTEDITGEIRESEYPFQQQTSCLRCHSSIDEFALGYRNVTGILTAKNPDLEQTAGVNAEAIVSLVPISDTSPTFAVRYPKGTLHYRELVTATKKKMPFTSIAEAGELLSQGQDLYTCAAKRYYKFFTGVDVDLTQKAVRKVDKIHQDKVIALGKALKKDQSVRNLIYGIFSSPAFQAVNNLTEHSE